MTTKHKVSFVIASRNENPSTVDATVQGLLATSYYGNWREVIVVDDCSDQRYSYQHPEVIVLRNAEPIGACRSRRRGCAAAFGDVLVCLDAHMSFSPGWLEEILKYVDTGALLCPPWMNYRQTQGYHWGSRFGWRSQRDHSKSQIVGLQYEGLGQPEPLAPLVDIPMVIGACYIMRKDAYEAIGGWNPHYSIYGSEEQDISARAWLFGNGVKCVTGARVGHLDRDTANTTPFNILWSHFEQNQAIMIKSLFEPETTRLLEDYLEPMLPEVRQALAKADIAGWREFLQPRRKMSDAEFFRRFLKGQSPIVFSGGRPRLKRGEMPPGVVHRAVVASEDKLWEKRARLKPISPKSKAVEFPPRQEHPSVLGQRPPVDLHADLEHVEWEASITVKAFDLNLGFQVDDTKLLKPLTGAFAPDWIPGPESGVVDLLYSLIHRGSTLRLYAGSGFVGEAASLAELPALVAGSLRYELVERAPAHLFIDAAVVGWRGQAALILGDRWSGRTSLLIELLRAGADYYSHAFAVMDMQGRILPFAQPVAFLGADGKPEREWPLTAFQCGTEAIPVGLVVEARLSPGARWKPHSISRANAVRTLFGRTVNVRRHGLEGFRALQRAMTDVVMLEGQHDDPKATAVALLRRLDKHSAEFRQARIAPPKGGGR